jgi:hypothetical protein
MTHLSFLAEGGINQEAADRADANGTANEEETRSPKRGAKPARRSARTDGRRMGV